VPGRAWRLRLEYLRWGNDEMESRHGFRLPVEPVVERDLAGIAKFEPPDGHLLLAFEGDVAFGIACLRQIGPDTAGDQADVRPAVSSSRRGRPGDVRPAHRAGYRRRVPVDPARQSGFMTAAHDLYRSAGFTDIEPYPESEIPDAYKPHWVFMERSLRPETSA